jgi:hypothetical protein
MPSISVMPGRQDLIEGVIGDLGDAIAPARDAASGEGMRYKSPKPGVLGPVVVEHLGGDDQSCRGIVDNEVLEPGLTPTQQFVVAQGLAGGLVAGDEPDAVVGLDNRGRGA